MNQPQHVAEIIIRMDAAGEVYVQGNIPNLTGTLGMLEAAKTLLVPELLKRKQSQIESAGAPLLGRLNGRG
jgi:hypothetical protein